MRSALAKVKGVEASNIEIDNTNKTATVRVDGPMSEKMIAELIAVFEGTRFGATVKT